jgi:hypothetical protein
VLIVLKKAFLDRIYIISTLPIALLSFWAIQVTILDGGFLPFTLVLLLLLLSGAEYFVAFEIRRANALLQCEIQQPARPWYSNSLWSWEGIKQRFTSSKAWFAIAYVFVATFFSFVGVWILILFWASIAVLIFALGIVKPDAWSWYSHMSDINISGRVGFFLDSDKLKITFNGFDGRDLFIPDQLTWFYTSGWTIALCYFFILLNIFLIPVISRQMKDIVENLLGARSAAGPFEQKAKDWFEGKKKS